MLFVWRSGSTHIFRKSFQPSLYRISSFLGTRLEMSRLSPVFRLFLRAHQARCASLQTVISRLLYVPTSGACAPEYTTVYRLIRAHAQPTRKMSGQTCAQFLALVRFTILSNRARINGLQTTTIMSMHRYRAGVC